MEITTDKEAFDYIYKSLMEQGHRSTDTNGDSCLYRGFNGDLIDQMLEEANFKAIKNSKIDNSNDDDDETYEKLLEKYELEAYEYFSENLYRNSKCAVGHIISDDHYSPDLEGKVVFGLDTEDVIVSAIVLSNQNWKFDEKSVELLERMQRIHDTVRPEDWSSNEYGFGRMIDHFDDDGKYIGN